MDRSASSKSPSIKDISFTSETDLAWLTSDGTVRQWHTSRLSAPQRVSAASFLAYTDSILSVSDGAVVRVRHYDCRTQHLRHVTKSTSSAGNIVAITKAVPDKGDIPAGVFAVHENPHLRIHAYSGAVLEVLDAEYPLSVAAFGPDATTLVTGDTNGGLHIYSSQRKAGPTHIRPHRRMVTSISVTSDRVASVGLDGRLCITLLQPSVKISCTAHPEKHVLHAVSMGAGILAAGGTGCTLRIWRIPDTKKLGEPFVIHNDLGAPIRAVRISPNGTSVAVGCSDGTVRLFSVPSESIPIAESDAVEQDASNESHGAFLESRRPDRRLLFCPSSEVTLTCPICTNPFDDDTHTPLCSAVCGHTYACSTCNDRLYATDPRPICTLCRAVLRDVAPNFDLLRVLQNVNESADLGVQQKHSVLIDEADDFIETRRLHWIEDDSLAVVTLHCSAIFPGTMDGEPVAIQLPLHTKDVSFDALFRGGAGSHAEETMRNIARLRRIRAPHVVQMYGVSREIDGRVLVVTELPVGGTLSNNLSVLRSCQRTLSSSAVVILALQIVRSVRTIHEMGFCLGYSVSPKCIGLDAALMGDWGSHGQKLKLMDLGGTLSRQEAKSVTARIIPAHFVPYMAPEVLRLDSRTDIGMKEELAFRRACQADMYAVGVLLWEIVTTAVPFSEMSSTQIVGAVVGRDERPGDIPGWIPPRMRELIARLWETDPENRPTIVEACEILEEIPSAPPPLVDSVEEQQTQISSGVQRVDQTQVDHQNVVPIRDQVKHFHEFA